MGIHDLINLRVTVSPSSVLAESTHITNGSEHVIVILLLLLVVVFVLVRRVGSPTLPALTSLFQHNHSRQFSTDTGTTRRRLQSSPQYEDSDVQTQHTTPDDSTTPTCFLGPKGGAFLVLACFLALVFLVLLPAFAMWLSMGGEAMDDRRDCCTAPESDDSVRQPGRHELSPPQQVGAE